MSRAILIFRAWRAVLMTFLLIWPPIHLLLAKSFGFSSWRYAGWGMYATPERGASAVYIFFNGCERHPLSFSEGQGEVFNRLKLNVFFLKDGLAAPAHFAEMSDEEKRILHGLIKLIKSFGKPDDMFRLTQWLAPKIGADEDRPSRALIVGHPHFDGESNYLYYEQRGFIWADGRLRAVAGRTPEEVISEVSLALGQCGQNESDR